MATTPSIKVIKSIPYQSGSRLVSNRYHFNGGTPADASHWHTLMDNVVAAEKLIYSALVEITDCIGYGAGSDIPVASKSYTTAGTWAATGPVSVTPSNVAILGRWSTAARTSKNHPVYLFSYFKGAYVDSASSGDQDTPAPAQVSLIDTYLGDWITGFSDGSITAVRAGPNGATATGHQVDPWLTHRDYPR